MDSLEENLLSLWNKSNFPSASLIISTNLEASAAKLNKFFTFALQNHTKLTPENNPDIIYIRANTGDSNPSKEIKIDQIRSLHQQINMKGSISPYKFCVIIGTENLNLNAANALLKVLEDPPLHSFFILLTSSVGQILPTIASRLVLIAKDELYSKLDDKANSGIISFLASPNNSNKDKLKKIEEFIQQDLDLKAKYSNLQKEIFHEVGQIQKNQMLAEYLVNLLHDLGRYNLDIKHIMFLILIKLN